MALIIPHCPCIYFRFKTFENAATAQPEQRCQGLKHQQKNGPDSDEYATLPRSPPSLTNLAPHSRSPPSLTTLVHHPRSPTSLTTLAPLPCSTALQSSHTRSFSSCPLLLVTSIFSEFLYKCLFIFVQSSILSVVFSTSLQNPLLFFALQSCLNCPCRITKKSFPLDTVVCSGLWAVGGILMQIVSFDIVELCLTDYCLYAGLE